MGRYIMGYEPHGENLSKKLYGSGLEPGHRAQRQRAYLVYEAPVQSEEIQKDNTKQTHEKTEARRKLQMKSKAC